MNAGPLDYATPNPARARRTAVLLLVFGMTLPGAATVAAVVRARVSASSQRARNAPALIDAAAMTLRELERGLLLFEADAGRLPTDAEGLAALTARPAAAPFWDGPYVRRPATDPWGNRYAYSAAGRPWRVTSHGPDGTPGTPDDVAPRTLNCATGYMLEVESRTRRRALLLRTLDRFSWAFLLRCDLTSTREDHEYADRVWARTASQLDRALLLFPNAPPLLGGDGTAIVEATTAPRDPR
jgi:general secretion pathway protein G